MVTAPRLASLLLLAVVAAAALAPRRAPAAPPPTAVEVAREVDALLERAWKEAGVAPSPPADDATLLRRLSLDLEGVIPEERTVAAVLSQRGGDAAARRATWIRALLHGQGYARTMAGRWANELVGRRVVFASLDAAEPEQTLVAWLSRQVAAGARWDAVVRDLVAPPQARGGPAEYRDRYGGRVAEVTGNLMRVFQGLSLQCAECHDHPYDDAFTQRDFWGVAAFLAPGPQVAIPGRGERVAARFLGGEAPAPGADRARELARLLTAPGNPGFARATVNRVWAAFFGRAFQDPDDVTQRPRLPEVLARLERDFVESGHDLRRLCEVVLSTRAYGLASTGPAATKAAQQEVFARARLRPLSPEQLWTSLARATGLEDDPDALRARRREFFRTFAGESADEVASDAYTITQALSLLNGPITNSVLRVGADGSPVMTRVLGLATLDEQVASIYLRTVGRAPTRAERQALRDASAGLSSDGRAQLLADLCWALLNSSEFVTNH
ncbi:MAG: DUF1549 and DUF1553 domain-containing protein [Planctomycetes bacterium]|nr:DUF1549 and DUF1553 domain-containing protein [Planctomycetota bacterium]